MSSTQEDAGAGVFFRAARPGVAARIQILAVANLFVILIYELVLTAMPLGGDSRWATALALLVAAAAGAGAGFLVVALRGGALILLALAILLVLEASWSAAGFSNVGSGYASWVADPGPESHWEWRWSGMVCAVGVAVAGRFSLRRWAQ